MRKVIFALMGIAGLLSCTSNDKPANISSVVKEMTSPAADSSAEPYLFTDKKGIVFLSWIEKKGKQSQLKFSSLQGEQWSAPATIASGDDWFVNWADYPVIVSDGDKSLMAHFLQKSDTAKFTYDVKFISSADSGKSWTNPSVLHDDGKQAEHGFVSIIPYNDQFFVSWLDGRKTAMEGNMDHHDGHHGEMTLRGAMIDKNGNKTKDWELDGRVCDCCQTSVAVTSNGPVVVYRDRSGEEIRDMSIVRLVNGEWTAPKSIFPDNWKIAGCPVNGPRADAIGNNLAVAWFSMPDNKAQVNLVFSDNGGESFSTPVRIDEGKPIGRVDVLMLDSATAMVSWMEGPAIKTVKVHKDGTKESSIMIASSSEARSSGFPQMTKTGNKIAFAWTDSKTKTIKTATLDL